MRKILSNVKAVLGAEQRYVPRPVDVVIEGERIAAVVAGGSATDGERVPLDGCLLVPGLVNGHQHSHEHFHKGRLENLPLELWMHYVRAPRPVRLTPRQAYLRTMVGALEALRSGATTLVDDVSLGQSIDPATVEAIFQAYEDAGIRALVGFSMMDRAIVDNFPDVDTIFAPDLLAQLRAQPRPSPDAFFALLETRLAQHHPHHNRVSIAISPSAPQRCTPEFLARCRAFADAHALPVIIHVQETWLQVVTAQAFYGKPMVMRLAELGFLRPGTSLIHAVWLSDPEIECLAQSGASVQHNPWSNLMLGSGVQPVRALLDAGVNVSLGSDGCASTVTGNMLNVLGSAAALSKIRGNDHSRWLSASEALRAGTVGGASALGLGGQLGAIAPGYRADLVAYRTDTISFTPLTDPVRQLVYAERGASIDSVFVAGDAVLRNGRLTRVDEPALLREISAAYEALSAEFDLADESVAPLRAEMEKVYARAQTLHPEWEPYAAKLAR
ncbi:5-methylthioadenosine/S-adenosylhomocysteine deaminase [Paraburkholderia sp. WC7.3g]|uniref:Amidohydrolase family protein n=1 Tax=Paraburkholderia podalyriae TaxID=1938811 RepID=A0ABR7Q0G8_9BURK|nr:amidohydrolase family protein [Paraburkholderia podalyriae]MBC8751998.1 amidohydrolase family protein [Paraburkholderia podalyriae]